MGNTNISGIATFGLCFSLGFGITFVQSFADTQDAKIFDKFIGIENENKF